MEVILREDVPHLGSIGDVVKVKPGFARNYLLPRGLAIVADKRNLREVEHQKRVVAHRRERAVTAAKSAAEKLGAVRLTIKARAGEEGKLFGSVTNIDIERGLSDQGFIVERRKIRLDEPIKTLGEHKVSIHLGVGVDTQIVVMVESVEAPLPATEDAAAE